MYPKLILGRCFLLIPPWPSWQLCFLLGGNYFSTVIIRTALTLIIRWWTSVIHHNWSHSHKVVDICSWTDLPNSLLMNWYFLRLLLVFSWEILPQFQTCPHHQSQFPHQLFPDASFKICHAIVDWQQNFCQFCLLKNVLGLAIDVPMHTYIVTQNVSKLILIQFWDGQLLSQSCNLFT